MDSGFARQPKQLVRDKIAASLDRPGILGVVQRLIRTDRYVDMLGVRACTRIFSPGPGGHPTHDRATDNPAIPDQIFDPCIETGDQRIRERPRVATACRVVRDIQCGDDTCAAVLDPGVVVRIACGMGGIADCSIARLAPRGGTGIDLVTQYE
jgi:hypothetical protein